MSEDHTMRKVALLALVVVCAAGCGGGSKSHAQATTSQPKQLPKPAHVDLAAAARRVAAAGTARGAYAFSVRPSQSHAFGFVTHANGAIDFRHRSWRLVGSTSLGEVSETIVVGDVRFTRARGGGLNRSNPNAHWQRATGPDLSPAGQLATAFWAAAGASNDLRVGAAILAHVDPARAAAAAPAAQRATIRRFLVDTLGANGGRAAFTLDAKRRVVRVQLLNTTALPGRTLVYEYRYGSFGAPVRIVPPPLR